MKKRGRPVKEDAKRGKFQIRMSAEDEAMLDFVCEKTGKNKTEAVRMALKAAYNLEKTRKYWADNN